MRVDFLSEKRGVALSGTGRRSLRRIVPVRFRKCECERFRVLPRPSLCSDCYHGMMVAALIVAGDAVVVGGLILLNWL